MLTSAPSPPTSRRLSVEDKRRLEADLRKNVPTAELAARYGISQRAVRHHAQRLRRDPGARIESTVLGVRLEADELKALDVLSGRLDMSRAALARTVLRQASGFFEPDEDLIALGQDMLREIKKLGTNLNQLAYHANRQALITGKGKISDADLAAITAMRDDIAGIGAFLSTMLVTKAKRRKARIDAILAKAPTI